MTRLVTFAFVLAEEPLWAVDNRQLVLASER
jgi:hypothetical protein